MIVIIVTVIAPSLCSQIFKIFFTSGGKGALTPLTKILRTPLNQGADVGEGQMSRRAEHGGDSAGG